MSRLAALRQFEQRLAAQLADLEALKNDEGLKREIESSSEDVTSALEFVKPSGN